MERITRRSLIAGGSAGALGVAGITAVGASPLAQSQEPPLSDAELAAAGSAVLHIVDAASGEVAIYVGENEVVFTDKSLVARVMRAAN